MCMRVKHYVHKINLFLIFEFKRKVGTNQDEGFTILMFFYKTSTNRIFTTNLCRSIIINQFFIAEKTDQGQVLVQGLTPTMG